VSVKVEKLDSANFKIIASIDNKDIEAKVNKLAKEASKSVKVDGFRPGKVPVAVVKKMYGDKLKQDAEGELLRDILKEAYKEAGIEVADIIGDPIFQKYEKKDDKIDVEILLSIRPKIELGDYSDIIPEFEKPTVSEEEIKEQLDNIVARYATTEPIKEERELREGDIANFDFTGYLDGKEFDGGSAQNYELKIGSGQFIPGFEEQMVGMKKGESKRIKVTFPEDYHSKELAGKEVEFDIKLNDIKELVNPEVTDELAVKVLGKPEAKAEDLKEHAKKTVEATKIRELYENELKPAILEKLVEKYEFDLPQNIVEQEIDNLANQKAQTMSEEEIKELQESEEKVKELRESVREDAQNSVKATFLVDALAKAENIEVTNEEISQVLYYEALMSGQDPKKVIEYYEQNNLIPVVQMGLTEDKLFTKLLKLED